jgi:hypothetical protein
MLALVLAGCAPLRHDPAPAVPQRPNLSSDTGTTHRQTFEIETGVSYDPSSAFDTPTALKYGLDDATELFAEWSPVQWQELPGSDGVGVGDVGVGLRHRFLEEDGWPSAALQLVGELPAADPDDGVGSGEPSLHAAAMATKTVGRVCLTLFYDLAVTGSPDDGGTDLEHSLAVAGGVPLDGRWGLFAEVAGIIAPEGDDSPLFVNAGVTHAFEPWLVMDTGAQIGLNDDAPDLMWQVGVTMNFGGVDPDVHRR